VVVVVVVVVVVDFLGVVGVAKKFKKKKITGRPFRLFINVSIDLIKS